MQKHITILTALLISGASFSQVGINTKNPQGVFNIDGGKDNPETGSAHTPEKQLNDVVVTAAGNVGIGTITPTRKLDIRTGGIPATPIDGFKLVDGTQADGKVLTTDDNGSAHWEYGKLKTYNGVLGTGKTYSLNDAAYNYNYLNTSVGFYQTGSYIVLPQGKWMVSVTMLVPYVSNDGINTLNTNDWFWMRSSFSDNGTANPAPLTTDVVGNSIYVSTIFDGPAPTFTHAMKFSIISGNIILNNTSGGNKTYHYVAGGFSKSAGSLPGSVLTFGGNAWGENVITAVAIQ